MTGARTLTDASAVTAQAVRPGSVLSSAELGPGPLPEPRGTLSAFVTGILRTPVAAVRHPPAADDDALLGEDAALSLYCLYELHYRGFAGVTDGWEWEPSLLHLRRDLEGALLAALHREIAAADLPVSPDRPTAATVRPTTTPATGSVVGSTAGPVTGSAAAETAQWVAESLRQLVDAPGGPSVSGFLAQQGTLEHFREFAIHRSLLQLKEADPHTWALPRLSGAAKAALVEIQADEYGDGVERDMHQTLFGTTMRALGLDPSYGAYLDRVPAATIATVNLPSYLGLHRAHRAALVGHLAVFEMTSVGPMSAYSAALRRLGLPAPARLFFDTHVVADAHHQYVAADSLAGGLVRAEPHLADDLLFGARAAMALEARAARRVLADWDAGRSALRPPAP